MESKRHLQTVVCMRPLQIESTKYLRFLSLLRVLGFGLLMSDNGVTAFKASLYAIILESFL